MSVLKYRLILSLACTLIIMGVGLIAVCWSIESSIDMMTASVWMQQVSVVLVVYMAIGWIVPCAIGAVLLMSLPTHVTAPSPKREVPPHSCGLLEIDAEVQAAIDAYERKYPHTKF